MACGHCENCGTGLERNGVCPNCDEAAFIEDWMGDCMVEPRSTEFQEEIDDGRRRARTRVDGTRRHLRKRKFMVWD